MDKEYDQTTNDTDVVVVKEPQEVTCLVDNNKTDDDDKIDDNLNDNVNNNVNNNKVDNDNNDNNNEADEKEDSHSMERSTPQIDGYDLLEFAVSQPEPNGQFPESLNATVITEYLPRQLRRHTSPVTARDNTPRIRGEVAITRFRKIDKNGLADKIGIQYGDILLIQNNSGWEFGYALQVVKLLVAKKPFLLHVLRKRSQRKSDGDGSNKAEMGTDSGRPTATNAPCTGGKP